MKLLKNTTLVAPNKWVIDTRFCDQGPELNARKIWETLYRITSAMNFTEYGDFLCDLKWFENVLKGEWKKDCFDQEANTYTMYWRYYDSDNSTMTFTSSYPDPSDYSFKIQVKPNEITIEKYGME